MATVKMVLAKSLDKALMYTGKIINLQPSSSVVNKLTEKLQDVVTKSNTTYTISSSYDLDDKTFTLPDNVTLIFKSDGKISNGTLVGSNSVISADRKVLFNVNIEGTWNCPGNVLWFAEGCDIVTSSSGYCTIPSPTDDAANIQKALDSSFRELIFPPKVFYVGSTLELKKEKKIIMQGSDMKSTMIDCPPAMLNASVIYTNKNITLLRIAVQELYQSSVSIEGGSFDVSWCPDYQANCIEVMANNNEKIWGLTINSTIKGKQSSPSGIGININPIENTSSTGYITNIHVGGTIEYFGTGIKVSDYDFPNQRWNWCTDLITRGNIIDCKTAVDCSTHCDIGGTIQSGNLFNSEHNEAYYLSNELYDTAPFNTPLIKLNTDRAAISANIYDVQLPPKEIYAMDDSGRYIVDGENHNIVTGYKYRNYYILENNYTNADIDFYGLFMATVKSYIGIGKTIFNMKAPCATPLTEGWNS